MCYKCTETDPKKVCKDTKCPWFVKRSRYYNCFKVMKYFIEDSMTPTEICKILDISIEEYFDIYIPLMEKVRKEFQKIRRND